MSAAHNIEAAVLRITDPPPCSIRPPETRTALLVIRWPDGTACLMDRDDWARHDWLNRPGVMERLIVAEELSEEQRRQFGVPVRVDAQMEVR